ncbi:hypothetical protein SDC9_106959 [bioreactor metagenome]|uniref:Uncharacterized protein n=1 Tax=bioreactor metagenome TaxID=1076179 RepID=A0A645B3T9_9ZZZZ
MGQEAHLYVGVPAHSAAVRFKVLSQDPQEGGFSGSVDADDAHLVTVVQIEIHILQQLSAAKVDGQMFRR